MGSTPIDPGSAPGSPAAPGAPADPDPPPRPDASAHAGSDAKAEARSRARAARRAGPAADPHGLADQALAALAALPGPPRVTAYASYGTEPDTAALLARLAAAGLEVLLPRVRAEDLEWCRADGPREVSPMGIEEPAGPAEPLLPVRAMLVPALAASTRGDRLGKGGGFYDRTIARMRACDDAPPVIAVLRDEDVWEEIPTQPHDERIDAIITPTRFIVCGGLDPSP